MLTCDVVIVGARAAGAATAVLLARAGHHVVVVDRDRYGADTLSTHALMRGGVIQLERWGLLDRIIAGGTPPVHRVTFDYGAAPIPVDVDEPLYAPRRTLLDRTLVDAAIEAGADVRFGVHVSGPTSIGDDVTGVVVRDGGGRTTRIEAAVTVGADGRRSTLAHAVDAAVTRRGTNATAAIYGYLTGVPASGYEWYYGSDSAAGVIPTNDGRVCVFVGASSTRFRRELRHDVDRAYDRVLRELSPELGERVARGRRHGPLRGFAGQVGWMRRPFGSGWALVGDAGYFKDPLTAHGITDALRDAELLSRAIDTGLRGFAPMTSALAAYGRMRDALSTSLFELTDTIARLGWSPADLQALHLDLSRCMRDEASFLRSLEPAAGRAPAAVA